MEKESTIFRGSYRDISYTINRFKAFEHSGNEYAWTHYIHLNLDKQIKDESIREQLWLTPEYDDKNRVSYNYYTGIIGDLEFHGGCTWYSKESSVDEKTRSVKIGCDYQHLWDEGREYSLTYVKSEVELTINAFLRITPVLKFCTGCGVYYENVSKNGCGKCKYSHDKY